MLLASCSKLKHISYLASYSQNLKWTSFPARIQLIQLHTRNHALLKPHSHPVFTKRTFLYGLFKKPSTKTVKKLDCISDDYNLIYRNTMYRYLLVAQILSSLSTAVIVIFALSNFSGSSRSEFNEVIPFYTDNEILFYVTCFITLTAIVQVMIAKLPLRIYNCPQNQKYKFVFYGVLPFKTKQTVCKVNEVIKLEESGFMPWRDSKYELLNKREIILFEHCFRKPVDLNIMLGYQKQPDNYN